MSDEERIGAALKLVKEVRRWACVAYGWESFWRDMDWKPQSQFESNGTALRNYIAEAEKIFPELANDLGHLALTE